MDFVSFILHFIIFHHVTSGFLVSAKLTRWASPFLLFFLHCHRKRDNASSLTHTHNQKKKINQRKNPNT
jgi:hypothetical protein